MKIKLTQAVIVAGSTLLLASGCISHQETVYHDVERVKLEFENEAAGRLFYETLSKSANASRTESTTSVALPIVFDHKRKVVTGPNTAFNQAVEQCDTNKDGKITEIEAKIFADQREKKG